MYDGKYLHFKTFRDKNGKLQSDRYLIEQNPKTKRWVITPDGSPIATASASSLGEAKKLIEGFQETTPEAAETTADADLSAAEDAFAKVDAVQAETETKEEVKEEPKEEVKEDPKEEVKEEVKEEPKEEVKEVVKEEPKKEVEVVKKKIVKPKTKEEKKDDKQKAGTKIVKKMGDKGRYDNSNQLKTLIIMNVISDAKSFFDTQTMLQDTPGFFSSIVVPDAVLSDNNLAAYIMTMGSSQKMNQLIDSQYK